MKEEDDMLELLDEEDLGSDSSEGDELELTEESAVESPDDSLELEEPLIDTEVPAESGETGDEEPGEPEQPEPEGIVLDIRYFAVALIAIAAILFGIIFFVLPMLADNPPAVTFSSSQAGEDLYVTHTSGDSLSREYLTVLINGAPVPSDKYLLTGGGTWPWSGDTLMVKTSGYAKPATLTLVYKPKTTEHTIFGTPVEPTPTPTPEPTLLPDLYGMNATNTTNMTVPVLPPSTMITPQPGVGTIPAPLPAGSDIVSMSLTPSVGPAPLSVQCTDQTIGCIRNRVWNFGDGQTSMKRNPMHVFAYPGTYNITLDVRFCDPDDNPSSLPVQTVVVTPSERHDTLSSGTGKAKVLPGARFFFTVKGPGTNVRIGGRDHYLKSGDHVQIALGSGGTGDISVISNAILRCNYSNVTLSVNGDEIESGTISEINIDQYREFETSDLTIEVIAGRDGAKGLVDGQPVINAAPNQLIRFTNVGTDSGGHLLFSVQDSAGFSFRGGIGSHEVTTPPPL